MIEVFRHNMYTNLKLSYKCINLRVKISCNICTIEKPSLLFKYSISQRKKFKRDHHLCHEKITIHMVLKEAKDKIKWED